MKTSQYGKALTKCNKVLGSCTRDDQLKMAKEYCYRFIGYCKSLDKTEKKQNPDYPIQHTKYFEIVGMVMKFKIKTV